MEKSDFVAIPASLEDIPSIATLQFEACASDPGFSAIHPEPPTASSLDHLVKQLQDMMRLDTTAYLMIAKDTAHGELASYAIYHCVPAKSEEDVEEEMLVHVDPAVFPPDANAELGKRLIENAVRKRNEVASRCFGMGRPYAYLAAIGTSPLYQQQGAASKLLEEITKRVDDLGLPMYIEATPVATALYQRFRFSEYDRLGLDLNPGTPCTFANLCMIRLPNAT